MSKSNPTRRHSGAGYSIPAAADVLRVSYKRLRKAIEEGQAKTIQFGKQETMTQREVDRLQRIFSGEEAAA
jgi:hypothetical protein